MDETGCGSTSSRLRSNKMHCKPHELVDFVNALSAVDCKATLEAKGLPASQSLELMQNSLLAALFADRAKFIDSNKRKRAECNFFATVAECSKLRGFVVLLCLWSFAVLGYMGFTRHTQVPTLTASRLLPDTTTATVAMQLPQTRASKSPWNSSLRNDSQQSQGVDLKKVTMNVSRNEWAYYRQANVYGANFFGVDLGAPALVKSTTETGQNLTLMLCLIPKSGSSALKVVFNRLFGGNLLSKKIHNIQPDVVNSVIAESQRNQAAGFYAFIREPLERMLSAFLDKCAPNIKARIQTRNGTRYSQLETVRDDEYYRAWHKPPCPRFVDNFDAFAEFIYRMYLRHGLQAVNGHWLPQTYYCDLYKYKPLYTVLDASNSTQMHGFFQGIGQWNALKQLTAKKFPEANDSLVASLKAFSGAGNRKLTGSKNHVIDHFSNLRTLDLLLRWTAVDYLTFQRTLPSWICQVADDKLAAVRRDFAEGRVSERYRNLSVFLQSLKATIPSRLWPLCLRQHLDDYHSL